MGKTRDLFKEIRDTKGTFHPNMGTINAGEPGGLPSMGYNLGDLDSIPGLGRSPGEGAAPCFSILVVS